jgi:hypothetical protein
MRVEEGNFNKNRFDLDTKLLKSYSKYDFKTEF